MEMQIRRDFRKASMPLIATMWTLTVSAWFIALGLGYLLFGTLLDLGATAIGILLICLPAPKGKIHGSLKLILQFLVVLFVCIAMYFQGHFMHDLFDFISHPASP